MAHLPDHNPILPLKANTAMYAGVCDASVLINYHVSLFYKAVHDHTLAGSTPTVLHTCTLYTVYQILITRTLSR